MVAGWVFVVVMGVFSVAAAFGVFDLENFKQPYCKIYSTFDCEDFGLDQNNNLQIALKTDSLVNISILRVKVETTRGSDLDTIGPNEYRPPDCKTKEGGSCQTKKVRKGYPRQEYPILAAGTPIQIEVPNPSGNKRFSGDIIIEYVFVSGTGDINANEVGRIRTARGQILVS